MRAALFLSVLAAASVSQGLCKTGFRTYGSRILDAKGKVFIMRGISYAHTWYKGDLYKAIPAIAATGANTIRVVLSDGEKYQRDDAASVKKVLDLCQPFNLAVMLEVHDTTGSNVMASLNKAVDYWISLAGVLRGREDRVMINIANEWLSVTDTKLWAAGYRTVIPRLRAAGLDHLLVVTVAGYGQTVNSIPERGSLVIRADPLRNTALSIHMYERAGATPAVVKANIDSCLRTGHPFVVGEFSAQQSGGKKVAYESIMSYCQERGVGWVVWSWHGNADPGLNLAVSAGGPLTALGTRLVSGAYGLRRTGRLPS